MSKMELGHTRVNVCDTTRKYYIINEILLTKKIINNIIFIDNFYRQKNIR